MVALENRNNKKFTEAQEDAIKDDYMTGDKSVTPASLSRAYGVGADTIKRAIENSFERQGERTARRLNG
jgi:hypothetical protein